MFSNLTQSEVPGYIGVLIVLIVALVLYAPVILDLSLRVLKAVRLLSSRLRYLIWRHKPRSLSFGSTTKSKGRRYVCGSYKPPLVTPTIKSGLTKRQLRHYTMSRRKD